MSGHSTNYIFLVHEQWKCKWTYRMKIDNEEKGVILVLQQATRNAIKSNYLIARLCGEERSKKHLEGHQKFNISLKENLFRPTVQENKQENLGL